MLTKKPEINTILQATPDPHSLPAAMATEDLHVYYGDNHAIKGVDLTFPENKVTALIGPSGCGKSTYLRALNRMNDEIDGCRMEGQILYDGININRK
ncbi:TPA: ATP-binding cassette domain-containing protein, partial [Listeria monocytogenes]|nr:ATP-binding cassette domain-containing protein [Listeria monocytogenes]